MKDNETSFLKSCLGNNISVKMQELLLYEQGYWFSKKFKATYNA